MLAVGGSALKLHGSWLLKSGIGAGDVVSSKPCALSTAWPPMKKPAGFWSTTYPLAFKFPRICDGFASLIRFHTKEEELGWTKRVVSPIPILKLCQLMKARSEVRIVN